MEYTTDNRYGTGASGAEPDPNAPAAYSARWIDRGDFAMADVLHDRQGFAYHLTADRDRLITVMGGKGDNLRIPSAYDIDRGCVAVINFGTEWTIAYRRDGGYIYVDAWLNPAYDVPEDVRAGLEALS